MRTGFALLDGSFFHALNVLKSIFFDKLIESLKLIRPA
jgi:hypothetical protein